MINEKDRQFIIHWEAVRAQQRSFKHKFLSGLPMAMLFGLPVIIFFGVVKIFFPEWFTTATHRQTEIVVPGMTEKFMRLSNGDIMMMVIAIIVVVLCFSYFRMQYKWEMNEQLYQELKSKEKKNGNFEITKTI
jgi:mannose/fructose/N-acetylgalactosamine-specific phosphotransferase system component IIC